MGDEHFTVAWAEERATWDIGGAYYALVLGSQAIFGTTNWAARLPSVLMGVLSIPAFYLMCRSLFGRKAATIGCVFLVLSDWHLYHSQMARFYSGVFLFGSISYHFYYLSLTREGYSYLALFFLFSLLATSFHATAIFIVVSCGAYSMVRVLGSREVKSGLSKRIAKKHLLICIILAILSLPKFWGIAVDWSMNPRGSSANTVRAVLGIVENMGVALFISALLGLAYLYLKDVQHFYLVAVLATIPLFLVCAFAVFIPPSRPRYMFYSLPIFISLSGFFCTSLNSNLKNYLGFEAGAVTLISSVMMIGFASYYSGNISLDIRDPVNFVEQKYEDGDEVVVFQYSRRHFDDKINVNKITKQAWRGGLVPVAKKKGRTWIIIYTYRTTSLRQDLEAWLMENASLKWRKEETRFDYTQRGYEVWLEDDG